MKQVINTLVVAATLAVTSATAGAAVRAHSKTILVESPAEVPALAQNGGEAMYLYNTEDGRAVLYVEATGGRALSALDVTNPANIKLVAQTPLAAPSAFDFVQEVGDHGTLIRYRDGSGVALISFSHYQHPVLVAQPVLAQTSVSETIGQTGLLLTSAEVSTTPVSQAHIYNVLDTTNPSQPGMLAIVPAVKERVAKSDTGTLFLLNNDGVTVVRQPQVEEERQIELDQQMGN